MLGNNAQLSGDEMVVLSRARLTIVVGVPRVRVHHHGHLHLGHLHLHLHLHLLAITSALMGCTSVAMQLVTVENATKRNQGPAVTNWVPNVVGTHAEAAVALSVQVNIREGAHLANIRT